MTNPYAPYGLDGGWPSFGLRRATFTSYFGELAYWHREAPRSSACTVFLHGVGGSSTAWRPLLLAARSRGLDLGTICLVDLPGFGSSQNRRNNLNARAVGDVIWELCRAQKWSSVRIVGHSMGGFLAMDIASRRPPQLQSVVAVSGTYLSVVDSVQHRLKSLIRSPGAAISFEAMRGLALTGPLAKPLLASVDHLGLLKLSLSRTVAHVERMPQSFFDGLVAGLRPHQFVLAAKNGLGYNPIAQWSKIDVPAVATFGENDHLVPLADAERVQEALKNVDVRRIADCGHFAPIERPFEVLDALLP